jgi:apolipoprotein N-acyltransferase
MISNFRFEISNPNPTRAGWQGALSEIAAWNWTRRMLWAISCAAIWVALEMIVARLFGGFPWNLLGVSQHRLVPLIQIASITGVPGLSFLVAWSSVSLLCAGIVIGCRPQMSSAWVGEIILPLGAVAGLFVFGFHRIAQTPAAGRELKVTMVQPSIPQTLIWNPTNDDRRFQEMLRLSEAALATPTDLLIWPEAAIPKMLRYDPDLFQGVTNLAVRHRVWMIVGSDDAEPSRLSTNPKDVDYYNCGFLVSPSGELAGRYRKRNLVVFGEYIPLARWLPFLKWFTPIQGGFAAGDRAAQFEMPGLEVKTSVLICFEDIFSQLARDCAGDDTDFLVNLTNDGWFGEGAAQRQHAAVAGLRAVENGLPLVRCTNTGLTCWFDSNGRLRAVLTDGHGSIYAAGSRTVRIPLPASGERREPTFYHEHGDWLGWGCVLVAVVELVLRRARPRPQADLHLRTF